MISYPRTIPKFSEVTMKNYYHRQGLYSELNIFPASFAMDCIYELSSKI